MRYERRTSFAVLLALSNEYQRPMHRRNTAANRRCCGPASAFWKSCESNVGNRERRPATGSGRDPKFKNQIARPHTIHRNIKRAQHANGRRRAGHSRSGISVHDQLLPVTSMKSLRKEDTRFNGGGERHTPTAPRWRVGNCDHQRMRDLDQRDTLRKAVCLLLGCAHFGRKQALPCQCVMKQIGTSL